MWYMYVICIGKYMTMHLHFSFQIVSEYVRNVAYQQSYIEGPMI